MVPITLLFWVSALLLSLWLIISIFTILYGFIGKENTGAEEKEPVSIIICARNEEKNLVKHLPLILKQDYPTFEVIIVNDNSGDGTYDLLLSLRNEHKNIKPIHIDHTPEHIDRKKYAITLAVKKASYERLVLIDADCSPSSSQWLKRMLKNEGKANFIIGYSPYKKQPGVLNLLIRYETISTALKYLVMGKLFRPYMAVGRNFSFRKSFFLEKNGFGKWQKVIGGDDDLLVNQYGKKSNTNFVFHQKAITYSCPKKTLREYIIQKVRHYSVGKLYRTSDKIKLGLLGLSKFLFWMLLIPAILSGFKPFVTIFSIIIVMVLLLIQIRVFINRSGEKFEWWISPFIEILYLIFYIFVGIVVLTKRKVNWN